MDEDEEELLATLYGRGLSNPQRSIFSTKSRVTFVRTGELNRVTKERVRFFMPSILAAQPGRNTAKVTVTCVSRPPIDRTKGSDYLGAYVSASLHKSSVTHLPSANPPNSQGRRKWDVCHHFHRLFSRFNAGDWQIWLELMARWDVADDYSVPYALAVSIEDLSGLLDIHNDIEVESNGRFRPLTSIQIPVR